MKKTKGKDKQPHKELTDVPVVSGFIPDNNMAFTGKGFYKPSKGTGKKVKDVK